MWFRDDLRLIDNDALTWAVEEALRRGATLLPVFIREATSGLDRATVGRAQPPLHRGSLSWESCALSTQSRTSAPPSLP
ncbi:deoxyribodipyrimidine photo-lyase [Corynebacterium sp.]|uniref:deoxyribodipyrimidine photo-lyase n=1 Tax=Corynebacterium sp. TaxID=1720 RepID=UPI00258E545C|nr:deoxyribodipyrimidine photo-lyase [Corynebacterium sp.]